MCLALPGELIAIEDGHPPGLDVDPSDPADAGLWRLGLVDFGGVQRQVSLACVPEARLGDQLLVHVGFALSVMEP